MRILTAVLALSATVLIVAPAAADRDGRGYGRGWERGGSHHHHSGHYGQRYRDRPSVVFQYGYRPAPRYVYRAPPEVIVVERPVVVERPIVVAPPPGVALGPQVADGSGRYCREYQTTGRIGGRMEQLWGVACLQPDGSWDLAS